MMVCHATGILMPDWRLHLAALEAHNTLEALVPQYTSKLPEKSFPICSLAL